MQNIGIRLFTIRTSRLFYVSELQSANHLERGSPRRGGVLPLIAKKASANRVFTYVTYKYCLIMSEKKRHFVPEV